MSCSSAAAKTSSSRDGRTGLSNRDGDGARKAEQDEHLRFANKELLELFRYVRWVRTLDHPAARELWRTNAPRLLSEASLSEPYMVTAAAGFGTVFGFYDALGELDNFFSEVCMAGDDALCLALPNDPDEQFIFAKRAALLRIGVPID